MKWTTCIFVRDRSSRRIVHHEIEELDNEQFLAPDSSRKQSQRIATLMAQYPSSGFEVFAQGFDSVATLYSTWPELPENAGA
jgi:hypothetical protein